MNNKIDVIKKNNTWELIQLPKEQKIIGVNSVYKTKLKKTMKLINIKHAWQLKGYKQEYNKSTNKFLLQLLGMIQ